MNILIVTQFYHPDILGGGGRYVRDLAVELDARGHRVVVLTQQLASLPSEETLHGIRVIRYGPLQQWWHVGPSLWALRRLVQQLHDQQPFDLLSLHQPLPACGALLDPRVRRLPWIYHFHSPWAEELRLQSRTTAWRLAGGVKRTVMRQIERTVIRQARQYIVLSEWMKHRLVSVHRVSPDMVEVVPGCADLERFHPPGSVSAVRRQLGLPDNRPILLTVRNLSPRMNLDGLIRAMRIILVTRPDAMLFIVGTGPLARTLQQLIHSLHLEEAVRLVGSVPDDILTHWYQAAGLFVMPSKALEGFGLATLEALACGTPVVGTPVGGTQELLSQLDPSLLCRDPSPEAMATTLLETLARLSDPRIRQEWSGRCQAFASRFSVGAMAERIEGLYARASRITVLHVHTLPVISGSGLHTFQTMRGLDASRYEAELACGVHTESRAESRDAPGGPLIPLVERAGFRVHRIPHLVQPVALWSDGLAALELFRVMRRGRYTIVHTHNSKAGVVGRLAAKLAGVPVIVHTIHGSPFSDDERPSRRWLFIRLERLAARWCDRLVAVSTALMRLGKRAGIGARTPYVVIPDGIDLDTFQTAAPDPRLRQALGIPEGHLVVGMVAKLWEGKGHREVLAAAPAVLQAVPDTTFVFVGDGDLRAELERQTRQGGLAGRVIFTGFREDIPQVTALFDIAVLASYFEGLGRVLLEAMALGKPVVATQVGGIPEVVEGGVTGVLVPPRDAPALADALIRLLRDPSLRRQMGAAGRQRLTERFSESHMVRAIDALYQDLMGSRC